MRSLRAVWTVLKREVYAFFVSPMAYVLLTAWLLWCGLGFWMLSYFGAQQGGAGTDTPLTSFFGQTTLFYLPMLVFVPLVTMRLLAEEKSRGTIELLLTAPVSKVSVVVGKYLASLVIWSAMWLPTLLYVWLASRYGGVDAGATLASYVGVLGIGVYYMAIGLFMSSLVRSQIVAAILTFLALGTLFMLGLAQYVLGDEYRELFAYVSIWGHMESFSRGVIDSRYLVFNGSLGVLGLVLTVLVMRGAVSARDLTQILRRPNSEMRARGLGVLNVVLVLALAAPVNSLNFRHYE
ncbi:MAG: ABC transporter permease subunit, partial [Sandaracinaceae bacterium]